MKYLVAIKKQLSLVSVLITISLVFLSCPNYQARTEIERCLFINQKIEIAKNISNVLDQQMAQIHGYTVFAVGSAIYNFDLGNTQTLKTLITFPLHKYDASPVIIFSHGLGASAESQLYLTAGLARRGNIVIAPDHLDVVNFDRIGLLDDQLKSTKSTNVIEAIEHMIISMMQAQNNSDLDFINSLTSLPTEELLVLAESGQLLPLFDEYFYYRVNDIRFLLDQLNYLNDFDPILKNKIDFDKLIMAGHSLGGATTLRLAIEDNPFKAFLCLSPASHPFTQINFASIDKPVLYLTGNWDDFYDITGQAFNFTHPPKLFISLKDSGHIIFTDRIFLYGLGIPFISGGEIGFTANLPLNKINLSLNDLAPLYPEQLHDYQGKSLTIIKAVSAFIDLYVNDNPDAARLLSQLATDNLVDEFNFVPK